MTQQPFYPPQYPNQPQQPYAQQPGYPQQPFPQPGYPQAPVQQGFPQQGYAPQVPPAQPTAPLAQGTIDDFYNQPSVGGGPSISFTNKDGSQRPVGTQFVGVIARDVTTSDVQQETDQKTLQPKFFRDGRPKFVMKVPLKLQPSQEYPDGEATWWVKGQAKDELMRAMTAAGVTGAPKGDALVSITLVQRKPMGAGMNPANIVQVAYQAGNGQQAAPAPAQATEAPSPVADAQQVQQFAPQQQYAQQVPAQQPVQQVQPQYAPQAPQPVAQQPVQQFAPQQGAQVAPQAAAHAPAQPAQGFAMPEGLSPEQQQLFAQLANKAQG